MTILMMTKLFGRDASNARKQATILIKGSILIAQKASPAPCCHTVTIPSPVSFQLPRVFCQGWGESVHTAPRSWTCINRELEMVEEKFPKGGVKSTKKCRCAHSGWLQHIFPTTGSTEAPFPADLVLPAPNRCFILP